MDNKTNIGKCDCCGKQNIQIKRKEIKCGTVSREYNSEYKFYIHICKNCLSKPLMYNKRIVDKETHTIKYAISEVNYPTIKNRGLGKALID